MQAVAGETELFKVFSNFIHTAAYLWQMMYRSTTNLYTKHQHF